MVAGYSFQIKPFNKIKKVLAKRKVADTEVNYKDEWKRNYFLERISSNIFLITKRQILSVSIAIVLHPRIGKL
jgi:hypothetical protein